MAAVIETTGLSKWYGSVIALNNVDIAIEEGITALLGPNGAGKTTLLKLLTGQIRPSTGDIRILGAPVRGNPEIYLHIALCPEFDNFWEDMNAVEFVTVLAKLTGFNGRSARRRSEELIDLVGLADARGRAIKTYSKGMRQRVKLAQALIQDPDVVFLDEPLTGLDPVARRAVTDIVRDLAAVGKSVVVSSHVLHEVEAMTDQLLLLARGRVVAEGDVHQIRESLEMRPYAIRVVCDDGRKVAETMIQRDHVDGVHIQSSPGAECVIVTTKRADLVFTELPGVLLDAGVKVHEISSPDDNIEAVFDYLVG